ncbi:hypothetical protein JW890_03615 [candidate division WOR-3 bacterium]|nr:hypothetical protein [candidate division WOR-3 bacterium]
MRKRVILFGKGSLAVKICGYFLENPGFDLLGVVPVIPEPEWTESISAWCRLKNVFCAASGHFNDISFEDGTDLGLSVFYDKIFPEDFIKRFRKMLNIHPGSLPEYRGLNPVNWALKNNEKFHGVTIHEVTDEIDSGPVVSQVKFSIYPQIEEVEDVYKKCLDYGWLLFLHTIGIIDGIEPVPQDLSKTGYHSAEDRIRLGERADFTREIWKQKGEKN